MITLVYAIFACTAAYPCELVPSLGSFSSMNACIAQLQVMKKQSSVPEIVKGHRLTVEGAVPAESYECDQVSVKQ